MLSTTSKEAIKTALAMTISYGIALYMDWEKPLWAGLVVVLISLATVGQSLNKGAMRMFGTLLAGVVALIILAFFIQDRWLFMLALSAWVGFCTYMMGGQRYQYFWQMAGLVALIITVDAGADSANAFATAALRAQQTGLGVLVYSLVTIFVWPSKSQVPFETTVRAYASSQQQLYQAYLQMMKNTAKDQDTQALRGQLLQEQKKFSQLLDAAESDSLSISEFRLQWRRFQQHASELTESMEHWRESFADTQTLDLSRFLPDLSAFTRQLDQRLDDIGRMLAEQTPEQRPTQIRLEFDLDEFASLGQFDRAALAVSKASLLQLDTLSQSMFECLSEIKGFAQPVMGTEAVTHTSFNPVSQFDPDRIRVVFRVVSTLWLAYLAVIYIDGLPGGFTLVIISGALVLATAYTPQIPVSILYKPVAVGILLASILYIFVMPKLTSFFELGFLLFVVTFFIQYLFSDPRQTLIRMFGLIMFIAIAGISNEQTYSFFSIATTTLVFLMGFFFMEVTAHIPFSTQPERELMRLFRRFYRSSEYLMTADIDPSQVETRLQRWTKAFHVRELTTLPTKLDTWLPHINSEVLPDNLHKQVHRLVGNLQSLSYRLRQLLAERRHPHSQFLIDEVGDDIRSWRLDMQRAFKHLSEDMSVVHYESLRPRLDSFLRQLEAHIKDAVDKAAETQVSVEEAENFYRLLGAYRGVTEALVACVENTGDIDWAPLYEERFA